jgi:hypothetical protein
MACTSFFTRVRCRTTWLRRATRRRSRCVRSSGTQTSGRKPLAWSCASTPASILSVLILACAIALTCIGLATITRATKGVITLTTDMATTDMALPVASTTISSSHVRLRPKPSSPERVMSTRPWWRSRPSSHNTTSAKGAVDVHSNHPPHRLLLPDQETAACGRRDTYGSALTAQPGRSQGRPATNASSQLIL